VHDLNPLRWKFLRMLQCGFEFPKIIPINFQFSTNPKRSIMKNPGYYVIVIIALFFLIPINTSAQDPTIPLPGVLDDRDFLIDDSKPTIVIVHGAWGGSWAFREVEMLHQNW